MRGRIKVLLGLCLLAAVIFGSVKVFDRYEGEGRSPYEKVEDEFEQERVESGDPQRLSCPRVDHGEGESATRQNARSRHVVVPSGSEAVLLCRYFGLGPTLKSQAHGGELQSKRLIRRRSFVRLLAREFNDFRPMHGTYSCPVTLEGHINALFSYIG